MDLATPSRFTCRFVPRKCQHKQLFVESYLRTNRTNHTKIMRCFPHCCPCHRKRSYCGSPLFVQFDQHHVDARHALVSTEELVAFGRFRPLTASVPPLRIGARFPLSAIEASLQRDDPSMGEWVETNLSHAASNHQDTTLSWVFEVNASARWYYPWSGAATIALRAMEHVFEVLVFRRVNDQHVELLADVASSPFRLMSFRRGATNNSSAESTTEVLGGNTTTEPLLKAGPRTLARDTKGSLVGKRARADDLSPTTQNKMKVSPTTAQARSLARAPSPTTTRVSSTEWPSAGVATASGSSTAATSSLDVLAQWLGELSLASAGPQRVAAWEQVVMDSCAETCAAARGGVSRVRRPLESIFSVLQVSEPHSPMSAQARLASQLDVIDATVRTLLHLYVDPECSALLANAASWSPFDERFIWTGATTDSRRRLIAMFATWSQHVEYQARRFVDATTNLTSSALLTAAAALQQPQRHESLIDGGFGFRSFLAQRRECFAQRQRRHAMAIRTRRQQRVGGISISALMNDSAPVFTDDPRVWVSRVGDITIGTGTVEQSLSLLSLLQFWRNLSSLRLDFTDEVRDGCPAQLCIASVFNHSIEDECFTRLTLDGRQRWFRCLPSGDATTGTTLMGYVVGDYVGQATSAGLIHVTTFLWPLHVVQADSSRACAWHWTIDTACVARGSAMTVSVVVETALIHRPDPSCSFDTMPINEKLRCIGRWDHANQMEFTYRAQ